MKNFINKKNLTIALAVVAALTIAFLTAWWLWPKSYEEMIPAQAKAVVRIQATELQKEVGNIPNPLEKALGIKPDGLDLTQPLYAFVTPNEYIGFCGKGSQ